MAKNIIYTSRNKCPNCRFRSEEIFFRCENASVRADQWTGFILQVENCICFVLFGSLIILCVKWYTSVDTGRIKAETGQTIIHNVWKNVTLKTFDNLIQGIFVKFIQETREKVEKHQNRIIYEIIKAILLIKL